mmetsp:Transcript_30552/g.55279  ORF Transcript_30552/g.55279 Transcript_30552/m.55279 type:complete len:179 (+) Transcript_30552:1588-2124(+)
MQYEEKECSFFLPKPLHGLTFDLHSKELHKERLSCMGVFKARDGVLLTEGYSTALSVLGASFLDVPVPEYVRIDEDMAGEISLVLCDDDSDRDVIALRCLKTKKYYEEVRKAFRQLRKNLPSVPGKQLLKKAGASQPQGTCHSLCICCCLHCCWCCHRTGHETEEKEGVHVVHCERRY